MIERCWLGKLDELFELYVIAWMKSNHAAMMPIIL